MQIVKHSAKTVLVTDHTHRNEKTGHKTQMTYLAQR